MKSDDTPGGTILPGKRRFATTRWSVVLSAGGDGSQARDALETLCQTYWYPLYVFVRRSGFGADDAQDLTQEFLARLIARGDLGGVDRAKGKFRSFLLASMKHFLSNARDKARALKRGGGAVFVPLDAASAEERYVLEPAHAMTADRVYERRWALTLLDRVLGKLRGEYASRGKEPLFEALKDALAGEKAAGGYAGIAEKLGVTEGTVKVAVHRLRRRYRDLLRSEISETVSSDAEVDEELRHLFNTVGHEAAPSRGFGEQV